MLVVNARISRGQMGQLVAFVAVCRLAILKRMPATPLTLLLARHSKKDARFSCDSVAGTSF